MISPESLFSLGFDYDNTPAPTQEIFEQEEEDILEFKELNQEISKVLEGQNEKEEIVNRSKDSQCRTTIHDNVGESETVRKLKWTNAKSSKSKAKGKRKRKKQNCKIVHLSFLGKERLLSPQEPSNIFRNRMISPQMNQQYSMYPYRQILNSGCISFPNPSYTSDNLRNQNLSSTPNFSSVSPYNFSNMSMSTRDTPLLGNYSSINISPDMLIQKETMGYYSNEFQVGNSCNYVFSLNNNPNDEMILNQMISKKQGKQMNKMNQLQMMNYIGNGPRFNLMQNNLNGNIVQNNNHNNNNNPFFVGNAHTSTFEMNANLIKKNKIKNFNTLDSLKNSNDTRNQRREQVEEEHNRIILEHILKKKDKRTTIMIRHIPNKYNMISFLEDVNAEFKNKYDLFYLPIDYVNNCNLGFAFINFVDPMHIVSFFDAYRGKKWKRYNSDKICELVYAKFQGKKELISHFEKGSVLKYQSEEKRPLILATPEPLPNVEIPLKFLEAFLTIYPYSLYKVVSKDKFVVESYYNF